MHKLKFSLALLAAGVVTACNHIEAVGNRCGGDVACAKAACDPIDILSFPDLQNAQLCLYDINEERLKRTADRIKTVVKKNKLPAQVSTTTNRRKQKPHRVDRC